MNDGNIYKLPRKTLKRSKRWTNKFIQDTGKVFSYLGANTFLCFFFFVPLTFKTWYTISTRLVNINL